MSGPTRPTAEECKHELKSMSWMTEYSVGSGFRVEIADADELEFDIVYEDHWGGEWIVPVQHRPGKACDEFEITYSNSNGVIGDLCRELFWAYLAGEAMKQVWELGRGHD